MRAYMIIFRRTRVRPTDGDSCLICDSDSFEGAEAVQGDYAALHCCASCVRGLYRALGRANKKRR